MPLSDPWPVTMLAWEWTTPHFYIFDPGAPNDSESRQVSVRLSVCILPTLLANLLTGWRYTAVFANATVQRTVASWIPVSALAGDFFRVGSSTFIKYIWFCFGRPAPKLHWSGTETNAVHWLTCPFPIVVVSVGRRNFLAIKISLSYERWPKLA